MKSKSDSPFDAVSARVYEDEAPDCQQESGTFYRYRLARAGQKPGSGQAFWAHESLHFERRYLLAGCRGPATIEITREAHQRAPLQDVNTVIPADDGRRAAAVRAGDSRPPFAWLRHLARIVWRRVIRTITGDIQQSRSASPDAQPETSRH